MNFCNGHLLFGDNDSHDISVYTIFSFIVYFITDKATHTNAEDNDGISENSH